MLVHGRLLDFLDRQAGEVAIADGFIIRWSLTEAIGNDIKTKSSSWLTLEEALCSMETNAYSFRSESTGFALAAFSDSIPHRCPGYEKGDSLGRYEYHHAEVYAIGKRFQPLTHEVISRRGCQ